MRAARYINTVRKRRSPFAVLLLAGLGALELGATWCSSIGYGTTAPVYRSNSRYHTVRSGETLYQIGQRYGVNHEKIASLNNIHDPTSLSVGQRLLIGYASGSTTPAVVKNSRGSMSSAQAGSRTLPGVQPASYAPPPKVRYSDGILGWPVPDGDLVSTFGPRNGSFHDGIDISAPSHASVHAAHDGVVIYADNELGGYGNLIILRGRQGVTTVYAHNSRLLARLGQQIKKGEEIAKVGATGRASGPHLHFEVRSRDRQGRYVAVDPLPLFRKNHDRPRYRVNESLTPILARIFNF